MYFFFCVFGPYVAGFPYFNCNRLPFSLDFCTRNSYRALTAFCQWVPLFFSSQSNTVYDDIILFFWMPYCVSFATKSRFSFKNISTLLRVSFSLHRSLSFPSVSIASPHIFTRLLSSMTRAYTRNGKFSKGRRKRNGRALAWKFRMT